MKAFAHLLLPALLIAALASCVATEPRPQVDVERDARALLAQGRYREAAHEYLKLADEARGERADEYRLNAAGALIASFELGAAQALLENSIAGTLPEGLGRKRAALLAEIALAERRSDDVLKLLPPALVAASPPFMARGMRELRSQAYAELGNHLEAAREAVQLEFLGLESTRAAANRRFIWSSLTQLTPSALESARIPPPDTLGGWVELAAITAAFVADYASFKEGVSSWQARFPGHPANAELIGELLEESRAVSTPPVQVALMLPLTGSFADAARAVRDGFVASWFADASSAVRPRIVVHDSGQADVHALFDAAVEGGAEFVVGPLRKSSVSALAENDTLAVPTLALNLATGGQRDAQAMAPDNLYQFALSPEDEARQVAERAWFDGHARVGVLSPQGAWGSRVAQAFTHTWEQLGGVVVEAQVYPTESDDDAQPPNMSQPVETLLNLDESEQRRGALRQVLGRKVHFEPRRRQDVDFIFMAGFPREARQLRPQLKFTTPATCRFTPPHMSSPASPTRGRMRMSTT